MDVRDELQMIRAYVAAAREAYGVVNGIYALDREYLVRDALWKITDGLEHLADAVQRLALIVEASHGDGG